MGIDNHDRATIRLNNGIKRFIQAAQHIANRLDDRTKPGLAEQREPFLE